MSKISERLTKLGQIERSGFGFGAVSASTKIPVILVGLSVAKAEDAKGFEADLYLVGTGTKGSAQSEAVADADIWGASVSGGTAKEIEAAIEAGADFIVAEGDDAPGAALRDDDAGKGYVVGSDVSEDRAKAINSGPFDFLILDGSELKLPLSVGAVLGIQEQLARYSQHIFLTVNQVPDPTNLELLRDIGISALIYDADSASKSDLKSLRETIDKLEPKKQKNAAGATLPRPGETTSQEEDHDDHDHDHEDEDWE
ncbi:hypothetical protein [Candidatus Lucifugimonas marina]|uniref:Uncharacterized protein n=1 Tax=Candidatus Lucifugimonas marina TaxID=3038979 RepID=A0AAJ5ZIL5_9CHLR|nr:hypothetical protein [SAR202 cluster bacterium JH702]MDG0868814.1 hypothetical protein [SAR202 cluster bacterium JH639]WFG39391.1 hypothetical protein GKO48_07085 [SAR202 cluster bacterium JH1073]